MANLSDTDLELTLKEHSAERTGETCRFTAISFFNWRIDP